MENNVEYSVVIPVYNSECTLDELHQRLTNTFRNITQNYEIILVDDCSVDGSWSKLKEINQKDRKVKVIHLVRNFGQHSALICGMNHCKGDHIIMMDDDLQNPPEEIPKLINKINEGHSVVYGRYKIKRHGAIENFLSKIFKNFMYLTLGIPKNIYISNFVICNSDVVKNAINIKTTNPQITALIAKSTPKNKISNVETNHDKRKFGKSNYNLFKHLKLSMDLFINYSSLPLELVGISGIFISILSIAYGVSIIIKSILNPSYGLMGWNSLMVATSFLSGSILMSIGIIGEYLQRILAEISYGQSFVIGELYL